MQKRLSILILLLLAHVATAQWKKNLSQTSTQEEGVSLVNQLLVAITPDRPENAYMTPFMKEKIGWVYAEVASHRLNLAFVDNSKGMMGPKTTLMNSGYANGIPFIQISGTRLFGMIRLEQHVTTGFNQLEKNGFALALVHEAVHHELPADFFTGLRTKEEKNSEELRTYREVDRLAVAQLLKIGEPLDVDYKAMHEIFGKCGDSGDCPAFQIYLEHKKGLN